MARRRSGEIPPIVYVLLLFILCIILYVIVSGCINQENYGDKRNKTIETTNYALNATIAAWNSSGHNSTIVNSSAQITNVKLVGNETLISTLQFNTTDGKSHTSNLSNYNNKNPVVLDIDNISLG